MSLYNLFWNLDKSIHYGKRLGYGMSYFKNYHANDIFSKLKMGNYNRHGYKRIPLFSSSRLDMVCILWPPNTSSLIHNHESSCMFKIIHGNMTEKLYTKIEKRDNSGDKYVCVQSEDLIVNDVRISLTENEYHQIQNNTHEYGITLHLYEKKSHFYS